MNIDIFGVIGEAWFEDDTSVVSLKSIRNQLKNHKDGDELTIYINSPGGSVFEGLAIYNLLAEKEPTIKIIGEASSIASVIACAGKRVQMAETSVMLFHKPWTFAWGNEDDFEKVQSQLKVLKESIIKAYQRKTNLSEEEIEALLDEETYHGADKCKDMGFADEVYAPSSDDTLLTAKAQRIIGNQFRKFYNSKTNNHFSQSGGNSVDYKAEYEKLQSKFNDLEGNFNKTKADILEKETEISALNTKIAQVSDSLDKLTHENADLVKTIEDSKQREIKNEVELDIVRLGTKIKPSENSEQNNFALTNELLWLRKFDGDVSALINNKTPYQRKIEEIEARQSINTITEPMPVSMAPQTPDVNNLDLDSVDGRNAFHDLVMKYAAANNMDYTQAFEKLKMERK
ncbi:hypothetical protein MASR1M45_12530 [Candidatus Kapaibacterium sp.]